MELEESRRAAIETRLLAVEPALIFELARGGADAKSYAGPMYSSAVALFTYSRNV
jgi:hypothetical protein